MSREIKFRAWDKDHEIMTSSPVNKINFAGQIHLHKGWEDIENTCYELMQFTGLKDKNGKEIYEGDIVKVNIEDFKDGHPDSPLLGIEYCNEVVEWNSSGGYWDLTGEGVAPLMAFTESQREVIGNVHEDPELLEEATV